MNERNRSVLILADIEGSSGCWNYRSSEFKTPEWARACADMSKDINAAVRALFAAGVERVYVKDFHRTGYNLMPELIDRRARVIHGYRRGPVPGIGGTFGAGALLMIGMHAASGSGGFLAHTMTSRIARLAVNGRLLCEAELFASSVADFGVSPLFFSGCPVACAQAREAIPGIETCAIDKSSGPESFDYDGWRNILARRAAASLFNEKPGLYKPAGPFDAGVTMRDGESEARKLAQRWGLDHAGDTIRISAPDMSSLYMALIRICYLTPGIERVLPLALPLFNAMGRSGLRWARRVLNAG